MINRKIGLIILLYLVTAIVAISAVSATEIYLDDSNGNDDNDGQSAAVKTMSRAIAIASDGDTINVASGNYTGVGANVGLTIDKKVTIRGDGEVVFDAKRESRIFTVNKPINVINLNFINGYAEGSNWFDVRGGAIYANSNINVYNSSFANNYASDFGGAIAASDTTVDITVFGSTFVNNSVSLLLNEGVGGGVFQGSCSVVNSTFIKNSAPRGGVFYGEYSPFSAIGSTFINNSAPNQDSGVIYAQDCDLTLKYNRFFNNDNKNGVYQTGGSADVDFNWWGSNDLSENAGTLYPNNFINSYYVCNVTRNGAGVSYTFTLNGTDSTEGAENLPVFYGNSTYGNDLHETWDARANGQLKATPAVFTAQVDNAILMLDSIDDGSSDGGSDDGSSSGDNDGGSGGSNSNDIGSNGNGNGFDDGNYGGSGGSIGGSDNGGFNGSNDSENDKQDNKSNNTTGSDVNPDDIDNGKNNGGYHDSDVKDVSNHDSSNDSSDSGIKGTSNCGSSKASPVNAFSTNKANLVDMENTGLPVNLLIAVIAMLSMVIVRKKD